MSLHPTSPPASTHPHLSHPTSTSHLASPIELSLCLPPQIISLLARASPAIHFLATLSLSLRWSHPLGQLPSWLLLFAYSGLCLYAHSAIRLGAFNLVPPIALALGYLRARYRPRLCPSSRPTVDPTSLCHTLDSFQVLADHCHHVSGALHPIWILLSWSDPHRSKNSLYVCLASLPFTMLVTRLVPLRFMLLFSGCVAITWSAPWLCLLRRLLTRSRLLRHLVRIAFRICVHAGVGLWSEIWRGSQHGQFSCFWYFISPTNADTDDCYDSNPDQVSSLHLLQLRQRSDAVLTLASSLGLVAHRVLRPISSR